MPGTMRPRGAVIVFSFLALLQVTVVGAGACSPSTPVPGSSALCNSPTGVCFDASAILRLASGYVIPPQYGATCTSGTYFIGPPSAWNGTCGATVFVLCDSGAWSGAYCGDYLPPGWELLGPDGGVIVGPDAATDADATSDGASPADATSDGTHE